MNNIFFSIELEIFSLILLSILYFFHSKLKEQKGFRTLKHMYILTFTASAINIVRLIAGGFSLGFGVLRIISVIYALCFGFIGYLWLNYCTEQFGFKKPKKFGTRFLCIVPLIVILASAVLSYGNSLNFITTLLYAVYPIIASVMSLQDKSTLSLREKDEREQLILASVPAVFIGIIPQLLLPAGLIPITLALASSFLILLVNSQYKKAVIDMLTKLPNRYGMDEEFDEQLTQYKKDKTDSFYVIACDMDNFKTINDTWGHSEGDRALKLIADILTRVSDKNNAMAFRNGGDEFVIITDKSEKDVAEKICEQMQSELDSLHFRDDFKIKMSMGIALYDGKTSISELLNRADSSLYDVKHQRKSVEHTH